MLVQMSDSVSYQVFTPLKSFPLAFCSNISHFTLQNKNMAISQPMGQKWKKVSYYLKSLKGVAAIVQGAIVQGAIVQGDSCPRGQLSKEQLSKEFLSKEIFVQVDSCPRRLLSKADFSPRRQLHVFLSKKELFFDNKTSW